MSSETTPRNILQRKASLERTLQLLLRSQATKAVVKAELSGAAAEDWHDLEATAKPLGLSHEQLLGLVLQQAKGRVKKALEAEIQRIKFNQMRG